MSAFQPSLFRPDGGQGNSLQPLPLLAMNRLVRAASADDHGAEPMPRDDRPEGPVFAYIELDMLCMHPCEIKTYLTLQAGESLAGKPARDGAYPGLRVLAKWSLEDNWRQFFLSLLVLRLQGIVLMPSSGAVMTLLAELEEQDGCPCTLLMLRPTVRDLLAADPDLLAFARSCLAQQEELRAWLTRAPGRRDSLSRQDLFNLLAGRKKTAHDSMDDVCTRLIVHADHLVRTVDGGH